MPAKYSIAGFSEDPFSDWSKGLNRSDHRAFENIFRATYASLVRYTNHIVKDTEVSGDLVQDAFVRLWEMRQNVDPRKPIKSLLFRMVRNSAYNYQRDEKRREEILREDTTLRNHSVALPDTLLTARRLDDKLQLWIEQLPERQREALTLTRFEGLSHVEVAEIMEISPRTVNNHLVKALETLRDQIRAYEPDFLNR